MQPANRNQSATGLGSYDDDGGHNGDEDSRDQEYTLRLNDSDTKGLVGPTERAQDAVLPDSFNGEMAELEK